MGALWSFGAPFLSFSYTFWFLSPSNKFSFLFVQQQRWRRRLWNQIISEAHSGNGFLCTAALSKHVHTFLLYSILVLLPCHCFLKSLSSSVKPKKMIQLNLPSFLAHTHTHTSLHTIVYTLPVSFSYTVRHQRSASPNASECRAFSKCKYFKSIQFISI